jgi:hypothetical protein
MAVRPTNVNLRSFHAFPDNFVLNLKPNAKCRIVRNTIINPKIFTFSTNVIDETLGSICCVTIKFEIITKRLPTDRFSLDSIFDGGIKNPIYIISIDIMLGINILKAYKNL